MKKLIILTVICLIPTMALAEDTFKCAEPAKKDLEVGMKVVAAWKGDNWWVGKVDTIKGDYVELTYSDGEKGIKKKNEVVPHPEVQYTGNVPPCFKPGDTVVSKWKDDSWWKAKIDKTTQDIAEITYADNEKGIHKFSDMVRYPAP